MKNKLIVLALSVCLTLAVVSHAMADTTPRSYQDLFEEIVNLVKEHFYNPDQIIKDFPAIQATYRSQLAHVSSQKEFSSLVNKMLHELKASHTYYLTPDDYEYYQLGALFSNIPQIGSLFHGQEVLYPSVGVLTLTLGERVFIAYVLDGSVAEKAGLLKGDEILSVNGKPYTPIASLRSSIKKDVTFKMRRQGNCC